ncbi:hypothetical protein MOC05_06095 [Bacillus sonorensis]|uniref:hypothetical protein n=1 Tax=Bacillus TaxID=1386 RepID=UPI002282CC3A|nr:MULTISPECIES: hypothetical protein [Bacillus]MCY8024722.1 hypothetical protein [Bacillus sonorensis]MCY8044609.1 hypothetical protein [Bacillus haynesii]MCY8078883.1 hypothetical protein [Bacillus haynesii]MCY8383563.1 hypothetical protein [Bacillus haynesii]MCY8590471.1 hypothetical protein [Bacillus haynesii]
MDKYDYIESVVMFLKGVTGINYQLQLKEVLSAYYKSIGKTYEMPDFYGGDQKNDGWVVEDAVFYQVYAPTRLKDSLKKEIQDKFTADLSGLLKIIYEEKKWSGEVKEFIFIVNTFDSNLPHDSERFFESTVQELKNKYDVDFDYRVVNTDYIRDILIKIEDIEILKQISATLRIKGLIDFNAITETIITNLIIGISGNLNEKLMNGATEITYDRISTIKKIDINGLSTKKKEIENIISKLDVVEHAVNNINQDVLSENKFERVKDFIIEKYMELCTAYNGVELYEKLINLVLSYSHDKWNLEIPMRFLIVYIFDKCDIFEKIGDEYDIA